MRKNNKFGLDRIDLTDLSLAMSHVETAQQVSQKKTRQPNSHRLSPLMKMRSNKHKDHWKRYTITPEKTSERAQCLWQGIMIMKSREDVPKEDEVILNSSQRRKLRQKTKRLRKKQGKL